MGFYETSSSNKPYKELRKGCRTRQEHAEKIQVVYGLNVTSDRTKRQEGQLGAHDRLFTYLRMLCDMLARAQAHGFALPSEPGPPPKGLRRGIP